ncbi:MAG: hypothetical protein HY280_07965 [Nitrospinae bacterium]|nr:hypothetical protein [Nitrospinota bacterium]
MNNGQMKSIPLGRMEFSLVSLTAFIAFLFFTNLSCATITERISLNYNQQQGVLPIPGASNIFVKVQVTDHRTDKNKVGSKKNRFGMEMAPIIATRDVALIIGGAIEQELLTRGYKNWFGFPTCANRSRRYDVLQRFQGCFFSS